MNELAIIGPTASGKSDLALEIAKKMDAYIFSIDSLSIYKEIDIASAKPSKEELAQVPHFGINELYPDEHFSVSLLIKLYQKFKEKAIHDKKNIVIVGGSSFYLKTFVTGISALPEITQAVQDEAQRMLLDLQSVYSLLESVDALSIQKIAHNDRYRLEKLLLIYLASNQAPSEWFASHTPQPIIENFNIYNIAVERTLLRERIIKRTHKMLTMGLVDEVCFLEHKYGRKPNSMGAIGIIEVLEYLDGVSSKEQMRENIITHTAQLAKRQQTFNTTQFHNIVSLERDALKKQILSDYTNTTR